MSCDVYKIHGGEKIKLFMPTLFFRCDIRHSTPEYANEVPNYSLFK